MKTNLCWFLFRCLRSCASYKCRLLSKYLVWSPICIKLSFSLVQSISKWFVCVIWYTTSSFMICNVFSELIYDPMTALLIHATSTKLIHRKKEIPRSSYGRANVSCLCSWRSTGILHLKATALFMLSDRVSSHPESFPVIHYQAQS